MGKVPAARVAFETQHRARQPDLVEHDAAAHERQGVVVEADVVDVDDLLAVDRHVDIAQVDAEEQVAVELADGQLSRSRSPRPA